MSIGIEKMQLIEGGSVTSVPGFKAAGVACGLKEVGEKDLALVYSEVPCRAAALFTTNKVKAAPVIWDQRILAENRDSVRAVVINSGNANACTGQQGLVDAHRMGKLVADELGLAEREVMVMSTGIIGRLLDMAKVERGIKAAAARLSPWRGHDAALAIMTTDTRPKEIAVRVGQVTIGGMSKGAGMIHPNLATMLCLIATDAAVNAEFLQEALSRAGSHSFNMITVDGDTSTNDTVIAMANGLAGGCDLTSFQEALSFVATELAKMIVRDGEGATKFVTVSVRGAPSFEEAKRAAKAIANSTLVKTALYGEDANWGRVIAAVGASGVEMDPAKAALWFGDLQLVKDGQPFEVDEKWAKAILSQDEIEINVDLGLGRAKATVWTCDLSHDYVTLNARYRT